MSAKKSIIFIHETSLSDSAKKSVHTCTHVYMYIIHLGGGIQV